MIVHKSMIAEGRTDLCAPHEFIQCAALRPAKGQTWQPHYHHWREDGQKDIVTQESWVVIKGLVKVFYYDTDGELIHDDLLEPGDASFTFEGGHNYEIMSEDTFIYEFKTGPYLGRDKDKTMI